MSTLYGIPEPRLYTQPLRKLTPHTSLGFDAIEFAEMFCDFELMPWQKWWLVHALELNEDGSFRFKTIITLVARQNGKTHLLKVLALYFMYSGRAKLVLGAAQSLDIAREAWNGAIELAQDDPDLAAEIPKRGGIRQTNGEQTLTLDSGARYKITAATGSAGRGLSADLLILDELREHRDWKAWGALSKTTMARPKAITVCISNAGDDDSVVLNQLRESALNRTDETLGLFEWSAPEGCALDDVDGIRQANPGLGHTITYGAIKLAMTTDPPTVFRTEVLCQRVDQLDAAISTTAWQSSKDNSGTLADYRDRLCVCLDISPDNQHATLVGAALLDDGRARVEVLGAWDSTTALRSELGGLLAALGARAFGWFPGGPTASLAAELRARGGRELKGSEVSEACQEFAEFVDSGRVIHPGDPLLTAHVANATKLYSGDSWRFSRKQGGHVDALYAAAGAVHIARTHVDEKPMPRPMVV